MEETGWGERCGKDCKGEVWFIVTLTSKRLEKLEKAVQKAISTREPQQVTIHVCAHTWGYLAKEFDCQMRVYKTTCETGQFIAHCYFQFLHAPSDLFPKGQTPDRFFLSRINPKTGYGNIWPMAGIF